MGLETAQVTQQWMWSALKHHEDVFHRHDHDHDHEYRKQTTCIHTKV